MNSTAFAAPNSKLNLKQPTGWFAAGDSFRKALGVLSDGAFKLFVYLCLEADRQTGRVQATQTQLARALEKSRRIIGAYLLELEQQQVCQVRRGHNQFDFTTFQICDDYWPYHRSHASSEPHSPGKPQGLDYVHAIRQHFLALGCGPGHFGAFDQRTAGQLEARGIALGIVEDALLLGACRKYLSWLNGAKSEPIGSLSYFEPLIAELQQRPLSDSYRNHLRHQLRRLAQKWETPAGSSQADSPAG
jgi:hypothetical protein